MPAAIFSLEMPGVQLVQRMLSSCARVDQSVMKRGDVTHDDMDKIFVAMNELKSAPIHIADASGINVLIYGLVRGVWQIELGNLG